MVGRSERRAEGERSIAGKFTEEIQGKICRDVRALEEELSGKCRELEKNESF